MDRKLKMRRTISNAATYSEFRYDFNTGTGLFLL